MRRLTILLLVAVIALLVWSTRGADRFEIDPAASTARVRETPTVAPSRNQASDPHGERELVAVRDQGASSSTAPAVFTGHLGFTRDGASVTVPKAVEVLLAPAESVAGGEGAGRLTFRRFSLDGNGNVVPEALHGDRYPVQDGSWSMAIPQRDLVLVMATADGEPWSVIGPRLIPAGATSGKFTVESPQICELTVVDSHGTPLSEVTVRATPMVPSGVQVTISSDMLSATAGSSGSASTSKKARPSEHERRAPAPPGHAVRLEEGRDSPIRFASRDHDRHIWVGKPGFAWARCAWPAPKRTGEVVLRRATDLQVRITGLEVAGGRYQLSLSHDGQPVAFWTKLKADCELMVREAPVGPLRARLCKHTPAGQLVVLDSIFEVLPAAAQTLDILVDTTLAVGPGRLEVTVHDPRDALGDRDLLFVCRAENAIGLSSAGQHVWNRIPVVDEEPTSRALTISGLPDGVYVIAIPSVGEVAVAELAGGSTLASVAFDLSDCVEVAIEARNGIDGGSHTLHWVRSQTSEDGAIARVLAGVASAGRAPWSDGAWHLTARPGRIDYELTRNDDGSFVEHGRLSIRPDSQRLVLADRNASHALVKLSVHRARVTDKLPLVEAALGSLRGPAGSTPALLSANYGQIQGEHGELVIRIAVPAHGRWMFVDDGSALAFDERDPARLEPGTEWAVGAVVKDPK